MEDLRKELDELKARLDKEYPCERRGWRGLFMRMEYYPNTEILKIYEPDWFRITRFVLWSFLFVYLIIGIWIIFDKLALDPSSQFYLAAVFGFLSAGCFGVEYKKTQYKRIAAQSSVRYVTKDVDLTAGK